MKSWAENLIKNLARNWVENWTNSYEQETDCEYLVCSAHDCSDSMKNLDDSSISDCKFWSMDCYSIWQKLHSCCPVIFIELSNWTLFKGMV